jgi:hypothetical protein
VLKAVELLRQGRSEELWQMCCGYLKLSLEQFMGIQERLLLEQMRLLNGCTLGRKLTHGTRPETVDEFRKQVPLTTYADYCPELSDKREAPLPAEPAFWVHTSGRSGDYPCKWVPITQTFAEELSTIMYGVGMFSNCKEWGDTSKINDHPKFVYTVAPRPYISGTMADILSMQTPTYYMPSLEEAEGLPFEDRIRLGFRQALSQGLDYFFGLSMVLTVVGQKFSDSSNKIDIRPFLSQPSALFRLAKGVTRSKLARRQMLPRDIWPVKGIISSGLDSAVYRDTIKALWGKYPLDIYSSTEGGIIATQTWDFEGMTFIPSLNFFEFIPEKEHAKWRLDPKYQPATVLLDEVKAGENYEIVISNFHGGALARYRPGDMIRITSLRNERLGIDLPQMVFERRADDLLDFVVIRLTERIIWQAIENTGIAYEDWTAYKKAGEPVLSLLLELKNGSVTSAADVAKAVQQQIMQSDNDNAYATSAVHDDLADMINFRVEVTLLPPGTFARYTAQRQKEGADLAHIKPPHVNPSKKVLSLLTAKPAETAGVSAEDVHETAAIR